MPSTVSIAHHSGIAEGVRRALDRLEGLEEIITDRHVAVKPNDTWASPQDRTACTQADTLRVVIRIIKGYKPARLTVTGGSGDGETDEIFRLLGLDRVIREEGVEFFDHNRPLFEDMQGFIAGMCRRFPIDLGIITGVPLEEAAEIFRRAENGA